MKDENDYRQLLNTSMIRLFRDVIGIVGFDMSLARFFLNFKKREKKAAKLRAGWAERGVQVPPFIIFSVTKRCNLSCRGCYSRTLHDSGGEEMDVQEMRNLIREAGELGVSIILLAGGEPLLRPDIFSLAMEFKDTLFPLFTNGLLIDDEIAEQLKQARNVIPVISMEGYEPDTDERRGKGVHKALDGIIARLNENKVLFGVSITVTTSNFATITGEDFIADLVSRNCRVFFFVEYIPVQKGTEDLEIDAERRREMLNILDSYAKRFPGLFIAFPGDEGNFGGCLSAGRGFVHVSPTGDLEPCPFAPYSDCNLKEMSLREALGSEFLRTIRENREKLNEDRGGCALWEERDWVRSLLVHNK